MFRVWAPNVHRMQIEIFGKRYDMISDVGGWWVSDIEAPAGTDYAFCPEGDKALPDPRSPWQPNGVHGPSRTVEHDAFAWTDSAWQSPPFSSALVYELHVGTFTESGTFDEVATKLDHLIDLGITHVELMPCVEFSGDRNWGYDGVDLYAPHHVYGGPEGLKRLINTCHNRGLGVILDVVYNHFGPEGNYLARFGPYFNPERQTPWGQAINYDGPHSDEVRRFACDSALMWLREYHADGLRLDDVTKIADTSAVHLLEQMAREVEELSAHLGRQLYLIAETNANDPRYVRPRDAGGYGIDAQWTDEFHHAVHSVLTGETNGYYCDFGHLEEIARALCNGYVLDGRYSCDRQRTHGRPIGSLSGHRLVSYLQTHDQVGNHVGGMRIGQIAGTTRQKIGAAIILLSPFVPLIFQGEEWAASTSFEYFVHHEDANLNRLVAEGRRREFAGFGLSQKDVPDPSGEAVFRRSKLKWEERAHPEHADMLDWYRRLIRLRKEIPALTDGRFDRVQVHFDEHRQWLAMRRGPVGVACNLSKDTQPIPIPAELKRIALASSACCTLSPGLAFLPGDTVAVVVEAGERFETRPR